MSYRTIAKEAGVSLGTVAADAKAGADLSSPESYLAWRRKHRESRSRSTRRGEKPATAKPEREAMPSRAPATGGDTWADRIERARQTERETHASYLDALARGDVAQLERLLSSHSRAVAQVAETEALAAKAGIETGEYFRADEVRETICQLAEPLRRRLLQAHIQLRSRVNPENPSIAEVELKQFVADLFRACKRECEALYAKASAEEKAAHPFRPVEISASAHPGSEVEKEKN
jgi:hypothetical protein